MMVTIGPYLLQIIVFAADPKAFLRVCHPGVSSVLVSKKNVFELIHTRIGKHQGRIIFNYNWCAGHNLMLVGLKKFRNLCLIVLESMGHNRLSANAFAQTGKYDIFINRYI